MSISAETYIVISLMFAVFAAVAAVGTSVVLGAGFERLRAGFELVKRQSGFFADAIYKLDQRTQKLDEEQAKLKAGVYSMGERVDRVEKQVTFMADAVNSIEQRILHGTPAQPLKNPVRMHAVHTVGAPSRDIQPKVQTGWIKPQVSEQRNAAPQIKAASMMTEMYRDFPEEIPASANREEYHDDALMMDDPKDTPAGFTTLLSRYFMGEQSGSAKGVVYH